MVAADRYNRIEKFGQKKGRHITTQAEGFSSLKAVV